MANTNKNDSAQLVLFKKCLTSINTMPNRERFVKFFLSLCSGKRQVKTMENHFKLIFDTSAFIDKHFDFVRSIQTTVSDEIKEIPEKMKILLDSTLDKRKKIPEFEAIGVLSVLEHDLEIIQNLLPSLQFKYVKQPAARDSLADFIKIAGLLKHDRSFVSSPLGQFESVVLDPRKAFLKELGPSRNRTPDEIDYMEALDDLQFSSTFIAHVSPSFEGKTQSAFVLSKVRPLYFALDQIKLSGRRSPQSVYLNFESLNIHISEYAETDLAYIKKVQKKKKITFDPIESISQSYLSLKFSDHAFNVLGFLSFLIDDSEANFRPRSRTWMEFYANRDDRPSNSFFNPMTVAEFRLKLVTPGMAKYCIFLDEFGKETWMVLIRNLSRSVGLRCIVANTNTSIANITGKAGASRDDSNIDAWSILLNKLNPASPAAIRRYIDWDNLKNVVHRKLSTLADQSAFKVFIDDILTEQMAFIRPGIMIRLADCLYSLKDSEFRSFRTFFNLVLKKLSRDIVKRKSKMANFLGCFGTIGLLTNVPYVRSNEVSCESAFKRKAFLQDHLYYIINPSDNTKSKFIAFASEEDDQGCLDILEQNGSYSAWEHENTYFKFEDVITILACLCIPFKKAILTMLQRAFEIHTRTSFSDSVAENPKALTSDANFLETVAAVSVIHSSHVVSRLEARNLKFNGRPGYSFIYNLIQNLIDDKNYIVDTDLNLINDCELTHQFLEDVNVPFLMPYNFPDIDSSSILSNLRVNNIINIGTYNRTANGTSIDGEFKFSYRSEALLRNAAVECKNWGDVLNCGETTNPSRSKHCFP